MKKLLGFLGGKDVLVWIGGAFMLAAGAYIWRGFTKDPSLGPNEVGDAMGAWNATLSGAAIAFSGAALLLQSREMRVSTKAQREMAETARIESLVAQLQIVEALIQSEPSAEAMFQDIGLEDNVIASGEYKSFQKCFKAYVGRLEKRAHEIKMQIAAAESDQEEQRLIGAHGDLVAARRELWTKHGFDGSRFDLFWVDGDDDDWT